MQITKNKYDDSSTIKCQFWIKFVSWTNGQNTGEGCTLNH